MKRRDSAVIVSLQNCLAARQIAPLYHVMMLLWAAHCRLYGRLALSAGGDETYGCGMLLLDKRCECSQATHIRYVPVHLALIGASRFPLAMMRRYDSGGVAPGNSMQSGMEKLG